jgi:Domain of unknown function (DUF4142)
MKKTAFTITAAALLISTSAFAQSVGEKTGANSTLGISPTTADFVKEAAISDITEIAAAKLGQERGNAQEKTFADQMITDHTKTSEELKSMVPADVCPSTRTFAIRFLQTSPRGDSPCVVANPSPPSGWVEDFHLQATEHAQHTTNPLPREGAAARSGALHLPQ